MGILNQECPSYPLPKERELVEKLKKGNFDEARVISGEIPKSLLKAGDNNLEEVLEEVKVKFIELVLVLSRVMVNSGANYDQVSKINYKFIAENYARQITLEEIAKVACISPCYLSHLFKKAEGISVIEYLTRVRIGKAKVLLKNSNYNIGEISKKSGYKEANYFTRVFRTQEGQTPSQFRKISKK